MTLATVLVTHVVRKGNRNIKKQDVIENVYEMVVEPTTNGGKQIFRINDGTEKTFYNKAIISWRFQ